MQTYYRVHWDGRGATGPLAFHADNAFTALWGSERVDGDPSRAVCTDCDGTGDDAVTGGQGEDCRTCGGEGSIELDPGYSCCETPAELLAYMAEHGAPADGDDVVVFTGRQAGHGADGEPLVVPEQVVEWMTWAEFTAKHQ